MAENPDIEPIPAGDAPELSVEALSEQPKYLEYWRDWAQDVSDPKDHAIGAQNMNEVEHRTEQLRHAPREQDRDTAFGSSKWYRMLGAHNELEGAGADLRIGAEHIVRWLEAGGRQAVKPEQWSVLQLEAASMLIESADHTEDEPVAEMNRHVARHLLEEIVTNPSLSWSGDRNNAKVDAAIVRSDMDFAAIDRKFAAEREATGKVSTETYRQAEEEFARHQLAAIRQLLTLRKVEPSLPNGKLMEWVFALGLRHHWFTGEEIDSHHVRAAFPREDREQNNLPEESLSNNFDILISRRDNSGREVHIPLQLKSDVRNTKHYRKPVVVARVEVGSSGQDARNRLFNYAAILGHFYAGYLERHEVDGILTPKQESEMAPLQEIIDGQALALDRQ